jgi:TPR repeat protein
MRVAASTLLTLALFLALPGARAADIDDADVRLFQVQKGIAERGDLSAMYYLGEMYEQGLGTEQSLIQAFRWYERAAINGHRLAKIKLTKRSEIEERAAHERALDAARDAAPSPAAPTAPAASPPPPRPMARAAPATAPAPAAPQRSPEEIARRKAEIRRMILEQSKNQHEVFE